MTPPPGLGDNANEADRTDDLGRPSGAVSGSGISGGAISGESALASFGASGPLSGHRVGGRYELVAPIASGGMARVWEGRDTVLNRPVAVKILHPHLATDRGFLLRFRREAVAAAGLSHRSIVSIYDTVSCEDPDSIDGIEAIVMELINGNTLRTILDRTGRLSASDAVKLGTQIADALGEAHRCGTVHRDIKPSNIMFCSDGRVIVTDFGIAKAGEDTDLTVTGTLLGTAKYLAPEQVHGDDVDPRADLYALGVVLFEVLTGRAPFQADTDAATALARLHQEPPRPSRFQPDVPNDLDVIVHRLLQRDPNDRFRDAADLRAALSGVRPETSLPDSTLILDHPEDEEYDDYDDYDEDPESFLRSERSWILPALALFLVATGLVVAGVLLSQSDLGRRVIDSARPESTETTTVGPPPSDGSVTTNLAPIDVVVEPTVLGAQDIDFLGDGNENPDSVSLAFDDDDDTAWKTDTYKRLAFGNLKTGVGYLVDLGGNAEVTRIKLETNSRDWSLSFYLLDEFVPDVNAWGEPIEVAEDESGNETFDVEGVGRYLLVWITEPGLSDDGPDEDEEDDFRFELAEIEIS